MIRNGHRSLSTKVAATKLKVLQSIVNVIKAGTYTLMYLGRVLTCVVNTVGPQIVRKNIQKNRMLISLSNILCTLFKSFHWKKKLILATPIQSDQWVEEFVDVTDSDVQAFEDQHQQEDFWSKLENQWKEMAETKEHPWLEEYEEVIPMHIGREIRWNYLY